MKTKLLTTIALAAGICLGASAQSSMPAPGTSSGSGWNGGGNSLMAPGQQIPNQIGNAWGPGMGNFPPPQYPIGYPGWQNSGNMTVIGAGYDVYGNWYQTPMQVSYWYNGVNYNVTVQSAYNPDTDMWEYGLGIPAVNTNFFIHGNNYNFYAPLSFGTFYFNL